MDGDCCRLRDQRHFLDGDGTKLAVNWTDEKRISRHAELGRLVPRDVAAQYFAGAAGSLAGLCAVPAGTEVRRSGAALGRDGTAGNGPALFA